MLFNYSFSLFLLKISIVWIILTFKKSSCLIFYFIFLCFLTLLVFFFPNYIKNIYEKKSSDKFLQKWTTLKMAVWYLKILSYNKILGKSSTFNIFCHSIVFFQKYFHSSLVFFSSFLHFCSNYQAIYIKNIKRGTTFLHIHLWMLFFMFLPFFFSFLLYYWTLYGRDSLQCNWISWRCYKFACILHLLCTKTFSIDATRFLLHFHISNHFWMCFFFLGKALTSFSAQIVSSKCYKSYWMLKKIYMLKYILNTMLLKCPHPRMQITNK